MRIRESVPDALDEPAPAALGDRVALGDRPIPALVAHPPMGSLRVICQLDTQPCARDLGPGVRLVPVHPLAAELDRNPIPLGAPGPPAEAVASLEKEHRAAPERGAAARGREPIGNFSLGRQCGRTRDDHGAADRGSDRSRAHR